MPPALTITIRGRENAGKSRLAEYMARHLRAMGASVAIHDVDDLSKEDANSIDAALCQKLADRTVEIRVAHPVRNEEWR